MTAHLVVYTEFECRSGALSNVNKWSSGRAQHIRARKTMSQRDSCCLPAKISHWFSAAGVWRPHPRPVVVIPTGVCIVSVWLLVLIRTESQSLCGRSCAWVRLNRNKKKSASLNSGFWCASIFTLSTSAKSQTSCWALMNFWSRRDMDRADFSHRYPRCCSCSLAVISISMSTTTPSFSQPNHGQDVESVNTRLSMPSLLP